MATGREKRRIAEESRKIPLERVRAEIEKHVAEDSICVPFLVHDPGFGCSYICSFSQREGMKRSMLIFIDPALERACIDYLEKSGCPVFYSMKDAKVYSKAKGWKQSRRHPFPRHPSRAKSRRPG